jgi:hypothetical protein
MEYFYIQSAIVTSSHKLCGHHYFLFYLFLLMHVHIPTDTHICVHWNTGFKTASHWQVMWDVMFAHLWCSGYQSSCLLCCVLWLNDIDIIKDHSPFILQELGSVRKMVADCKSTEILHEFVVHHIYTVASNMTTYIWVQHGIPWTK